MVDFQLSRLEKVWYRTTSLVLPRQVRDAGERVSLHLRETGGWELFHLVGLVLDIPNRFPRHEISIYWLVPAPDEEIGHRVVAEILTQLYGTGAHVGKVENVAVRFATEWEDWTVAQPNEYFRASGSENVWIPLEQWVSGGSLEKLWEEVLRLLRGECKPSSSELMRRVGRATEEITDEVKEVSDYEVEVVHRKSTSTKQMNPSIRIAMHTSSGEVGAIILIETNGEAGKRKVKRIAVAYQGEWPIAHHYRTVIPPPNLEGLKSLVKGDKALVMKDDAGSDGADNTASGEADDSA